MQNKQNENPDFEWCIVANIIDRHYYEEQKKIRRGTKHFRPGAKMYCFPEFGGMGHERIVVRGKPRKKNHFVEVVIPTNMMKNFRVTKVYEPNLTERILNCGFYQSYNDADDEGEWLDGFGKSLAVYYPCLEIEADVV